MAPPPLPAKLSQQLKATNVPVISLEEACKGCEDHQGEEGMEYPKGFDVDMDSVMLGSVNDYGRQIVISTGKSDWEREVTDDSASLAGLVKVASSRGPSSNGGGGGFLDKLAKKAKKLKGPDPNDPALPGIYDSSAVPTNPTISKVSILNGSFLSSGDSDATSSVIVLPDYKIVHDVPVTDKGAQALFDGYLTPESGRAGSSSATLKSWPLPYHCVVLICSHKRRDKKCHIAAPILIEQFHHALATHGFEVDERGDDISEGEPIESWDPSEREAKLEETLKSVKVDNGRVGIFKCSHIGGHRYAGNTIIYFPNGSSIWYGRVTPKDVGAVVASTVVKGRVIPELLRGGLSLTEKTGPQGVLSW